MKTTVVILAGGASTRFAPLVTSKPMFPFAGKPMVLYVIDFIKHAGFDKVFIVTNPDDQTQLKQALHAYKNCKTLVQKKPNGMADALCSTASEFSESPIFIVNASDLVDETLFKKAFLQQKNTKHGFIVAKKQSGYFDGGYLKFTDNVLSEIVEKPEKGNQPSDLINLVFDYFPNAKRFLDTLKNTTSKKDDVYEHALSKMIQTSKMEVVEYDGYWQPLKYPWNVLEMMDLILKHHLKPHNHASFISDSAKIDENVQLEDGAKVLENAVIKGPSYIGKDTVIGTNSLVISSMIEQNSVVGFASEVCRSYLGPRTWLHHNYIGDSVLEGENYCGSAAATANFRFDERTIRSLVKGKLIDSKRKKLGAIIGKKARLGVNVSLMPGVKIGAASFVGPGVVLGEDLVGKSRIMLQQQTLKKKLS